MEIYLDKHNNKLEGNDSLFLLVILLFLNLLFYIELIVGIRDSAILFEFLFETRMKRKFFRINYKKNIIIKYFLCFLSFF
jgi:hypothetical protein